MSNVYYITYISFGMLAIKPLRKRLDISLMFASFLTLIGVEKCDIFNVGSWVKYFAFTNYYFALAGYVMIGLGQIFILAAPVCRPI